MTYSYVFFSRMKQNPENSIEELSLRREQVKGHIESVLESPDADKYFAPQTNPNEDVNSINDTDSLVKYLNNNYDRLSSESDLLQGINLYKHGDSLVRDEREKTEVPKSNIYADKIYLCNLIRATIIFNDHEKENVDISGIIKILSNINSLDPDKNSYEKNFLRIEKMIKEKHLPKKSQDDIALALSYVELQNTHYNVSTITENSIISSLKLKGFNENIKNKLTALSEKTNIDSFNDFIAQKSAEIILNSKELKVIPASLSKIIPGLRDAYEDTVYEIDGNRLKESFKSYRSDSVVFSGYNEAEDNTIEAINTFKEQVDKEICLNFFHKDQITTYNNISNEELHNIKITYTPLNKKRDKTIITFSNILKEIDKKNLQNEELTNEIENIRKCREAIEDNTLVTNSTVIEMNKLVHNIKRGALRKYFTEEELEKIPEILSFHKSPPPSRQYFSPHRIAESFKSSFNKIAKSHTISNSISEYNPEYNKLSSMNMRNSTVISTAEFLNTSEIPQDIIVKRNEVTKDIAINTRGNALNKLVDKFLIKDDSINKHNPARNVESLNELVDYHLTQYDAEQGITRYIEGDNLLRDARNQIVPQDNSHEAHAWKAQCYNFCRAAKLVMQFYNQSTELPNDFIDKVIDKVENTVIDKESADNFKRDLIWFIADQYTAVNEKNKNTEKIYKKIAKELDIAINCSTLDDPSYNVATVMNIPKGERQGSKHHTIIQSDIKIKGFNEDLLNIFSTIASRAPHNYEHIARYNNTNNTYKWYNDHTHFKKFIAQESCKKILTTYGQGIIPVIPNQLRDIIPGLKNAYLEKIDHVKVDSGDFEVKNIMETSRASLPAYKTDENLTKMTLESFKEDTGTEKLHLNSLVTANEKSGPSTLKAALSKMNGSPLLTELPLNLKRNMGRRNVSDFDKILKDAAESLHKNGIITEDAKKFIETNRLLPGQSFSRKKLNNNLTTQNNIDIEIQKAIANLVACRELMNRKVSWRKYGSLDNHQLANAMQIAIYDISKGALHSYSTDYLKTSILTFCKSGKDRTGTTLQWLADLAISRALGIDIETVRDATIKAGQQAYIAGSAGGTTGALGIKNAGGLHSFKRYIKEMVNPLGKYGNSTPKYKKRKINKITEPNIIEQSQPSIDFETQKPISISSNISLDNLNTPNQPLSSNYISEDDDKSFITANKSVNHSEYQSVSSNLNSTNYLSKNALDSLNLHSNKNTDNDDFSVMSDLTNDESPSDSNYDIRNLFDLHVPENEIELNNILEELSNNDNDRIDSNDFNDDISQKSNTKISNLNSNSSVSDSSVIKEESNTTDSGYNIFKFNFNNLIPSLPQYGNPLNVLKNLNIFNRKQKSNITSQHPFNVPEQDNISNTTSQEEDNTNDLIYGEEEKESYLSSLYNAITSPFSKLSTTLLSTKPKHLDDQLIPSQQKNVTRNPPLISRTLYKPPTTQEMLITDLKNTLQKKFNISIDTQNEVYAEKPTDKPPIVARKERLNDFIKKFSPNKTKQYKPEYPEEKNLKNLIDYHTTQYDLEQGITRYIDGDNLIRDAQNQRIPKDSSHEKHAWKAQCYNFCRAAQLVLQHRSPQYRTNDLMGKIEDVENVEDKKSADEFKRDLVWFIADTIGEDHTKEIYDEIANQLDTAINCTVIDDTSYNIATVMNVKGKTVIQSDVKVKGFNQELLSVFNTIAHLDDNDQPPQKDLYKWYNDLDEFNQFISRQACKKILAQYKNGEGIIPVIPNQLRAIIPGLKNAYLESVDVIDDNNIKTIMQSYRSTLPAYQEDTILTTKALEAFKEDTGSEKIYLNSLLTANEKKGPSTLSKIKDKNLELIQSPLNILRNFGTRDFNSFDVILKEIANSLGDVLTPEAKAFIETNRTLPGQSLLLRQMKGKFVQDPDNVDENEQKAIKTLVECRELMNRTVSWRLYGSLDNNKLANKIQMVMHDIQNGELQGYITDSLKNTTILTFCKSGKDRTGTVFQGLIDQALIRLFGNVKKEDIMNVTIKAGQQAYLSAAGGGTTAAFGIKNEGVLNAAPEYIKGMVTDLATYGNRTPKYKKEITKDGFEDIDIGSNTQLTEENLKSLSNYSEWDVQSELTDDTEYPPQPTLSIFRNRFNLFRGNAKVYPESEKSSINNSETSSEISYASSSDNSSDMTNTKIIVNDTPFEILGSGSVSSSASTVPFLKGHRGQQYEFHTKKTTNNSNWDEKSSDGDSITSTIEEESFDGDNKTGRISPTPLHTQSRSTYINRDIPRIQPTISKIPEHNNTTVVIPKTPLTQNHMQQNNGIPIHPMTPTIVPIPETEQLPQNETQTNNNTPTSDPTNPKKTFLNKIGDGIRNTFSKFRKKKEPPQTQAPRPESPRSIADYDDSYYDDYDDYDDYHDRRRYRPQPNYYPPQQQEPEVSPYKIVAAVVFCMLLASVFGVAGLILGIGISAAAIEMSQPVVPPPPPPPPVEYRERDRMRGRGRGHEIPRSKSHAERVDRNRSSDPERGR